MSEGDGHGAPVGIIYPNSVGGLAIEFALVYFDPPSPVVEGQHDVGIVGVWNEHGFSLGGVKGDALSQVLKGIAYERWQMRQ